MSGITDIHCHILFRVDDGPNSIELSMEMLRAEYKQGVRNIILTPHYDQGWSVPSRKRIRSHFDMLADNIAEEMPDLTLYLGNEIMACTEMVQLLDDGKIFTLAGTKYVLIEFYPTSTYEYIEQNLRNILNGGYIPILAHCERYNCLRKRIGTINHQNIYHLCEMGAYMQVNVSSVYKNDKKFVKKLIEYDLLHFVASDAHSMGSRGVFWNECKDYLDKICSPGYVDWLLVQNPIKVIEGKYI